MASDPVKKSSMTGDRNEAVDEPMASDPTEESCLTGGPNEGVQESPTSIRIRVPIRHEVSVAVGSGESPSISRLDRVENEAESIEVCTEAVDQEGLVPLHPKAI